MNIVGKIDGRIGDDIPVNQRVDLANANRVVRLAITEASLSRIIHHQKAGIPMAFITAFRGTRTDEENNAAQASLKAETKNLGYPFIIAAGGYTHRDTGEFVEEPTIVIQRIPKNIATVLAAKYGQESILYSDKDANVSIVYADGGEDKLSGKLSTHHLEQFYTRIKGTKFKFESLDLCLNSASTAYHNRLARIATKVIKDGGVVAEMLSSEWSKMHD